MSGRDRVGSLRLEGVSVRYAAAAERDGPALTGIDCSIEMGSFVGVTGPSDAGKTTFCRLLSGFVPHFFDAELDGRVTVAGTDVAATSIGELGRTVGYVFEDPFDQLTGAATTALEEVAFGLEQAGVPRAEIEPRARDRLDRVGIANAADRAPDTLSGGQLQRLAIASVLALEPDVLVLDEPTSQLDPTGTADVFSLASAMNDAGYTIVLVSQDLRHLGPRADRLLVFEDGSIRYDDAPRTVLAGIAAAGENDLVSVPRPLQIGRALRARGAFADDRPVPLTIAELREGATRILDTDSTAPPHEDGGDAGEDGTARTRTGSSSFRPRSGDRLVGRTDAGDRPPLVDATDLFYTYDGGIEALQSVSVALDAGCVALLGHNGAGKTTFAKHCNGLLTPTSGTVRVDGRDTREGRVAEFAEHVGLCFQNPDDQLFRRTVESEVRFGPEQLGYEPARIDELVDDAVDALGLEDVREENPYDLGRSLRERVAIASVLAMDTPGIVLDEPTGGQDARGIDVVGGVVDGLVEAGRLVVCITHDIEFAAEHADRVVVLADGRVIADDSPRAVFGTPDLLDRAGIEPPVVAQAAAALGIDEPALSVAELLARLDAADGRTGE